MDKVITDRDEVKMAITNMEELEIAISELKQKKIEQQARLYKQFHETYEGLKPVNILKSAFSKVTQPGDTRDTILKALGGIGTGLLTKGLIGNRSSSLVGSILSKVVNAGAAKAFYNNADKLKAYGTAIYHNLFKKDK